MEEKKDSFEILRLKSIRDEYKDYKRVVAFLAGLGILGTAVSAFSLGELIKYNVPITTKNVENQVLYALGIFNIPIGAIGIGGAINENKYRKEFKKEHELVLKRRKKYTNI